MTLIGEFERIAAEFYESDAWNGIPLMKTKIGFAIVQAYRLGILIDVEGLKEVVVRYEDADATYKNEHQSATDKRAVEKERFGPDGEDRCCIAVFDTVIGYGNEQSERSAGCLRSVFPTMPSEVPPTTAGPYEMHARLLYSIACYHLANLCRVAQYQSYRDSLNPMPLQLDEAQQQEPELVTRSELVNRPGKPGFLGISTSALSTWVTKGKFPEVHEIRGKNYYYRLDEVNAALREMGRREYHPQLMRASNR